jgi:hypothetical protein
MRFDPVDFARFVNTSGLDVSIIQAEGKKACILTPMKKERFQSLMRAYIAAKKEEEKK